MSRGARVLSRAGLLRLEIGNAVVLEGPSVNDLWIVRSYNNNVFPLATDINCVVTNV